MAVYPIRPLFASLVPGLGLALVLGGFAGCQNVFGPDAPTPIGTATFTWQKDIEPVLHRECTSCHFEGGIGPFALDTYAQASRFANAMARSVAEGSMPPWLPVESQDCAPLQGTRALSSEEIQMFQVWAAEGAPAGTTQTGAPLPAKAPALGWVSMDKGPDEDYLPNSERSDDYRCFVIDPEEDQDQYIIGYDIRPGIPWLVHHVNVLIAEPDEANPQDRMDQGAGWDCLDGMGLIQVAMLGAWAPGTLPLEFPNDTGIFLEKGKVLVTQVHYNLLNGELEPDNTHVILQFAQAPVRERAFIAPLPNYDFDIPPNSTGYESTLNFKMPFNAFVWGLGGHMHQLGSRFRINLHREQEQSCLLNIENWRYAWQQGYFFDLPGPVEFKVGDTVSVTCGWDNPTDVWVDWGEKVTDEMCMGYFYITGIADNPILE